MTILGEPEVKEEEEDRTDEQRLARPKIREK